MNLGSIVKEVRPRTTDTQNSHFGHPGTAGLDHN